MTTHEVGESEEKYFTARYMMFLPDIGPLAQAKKHIYSPTFTCLEDPHQATFKIQVRFEKSEENKLEYCLLSISSDVMAKCKFDILDEKNNVLCSWESDKYLLICSGNCWESDDRFAPRFSGEGVLGRRIFVEVSYKRKISNDSRCIPGFTLMYQDMSYLVGGYAHADVSIAIGERKIPAHKVILMARSEYFHGLFTSGMQESRSNVISFPDVSEEVFMAFLTYIYSGQIPYDMENSAFDLFPVADKYLAVGLKDACVECLRSNLSVENVIRVLILAYYHPCDLLYRESIHVFKENVSSLKTSEAWSSLVAIPDLLEKLLVDCLERKGKKRKSKTVFDESNSEKTRLKQLCRDFTRAFEGDGGALKIPYDVLIRTDDGATFGAHRAILFARSFFFAPENLRMDKFPNHFSIPGRATVVREAIKFLYDDQEPENLAEIAAELLPLARKFDMGHMMRMCEEAIFKTLSVENVVDALFLARLHDSERLFSFCLPIVKANVTKLKPSCAAKLKSDPDLLMEILTKS